MFWYTDAHRVSSGIPKVSGSILSADYYEQLIHSTYQRHSDTNLFLYQKSQAALRSFQHSTHATCKPKQGRDLASEAYQRINCRSNPSLTSSRTVRRNPLSLSVVISAWSIFKKRVNSRKVSDAVHPMISQGHTIESHSSLLFSVRKTTQQKKHIWAVIIHTTLSSENVQRPTE